MSPTVRQSTSTLDEMDNTSMSRDPRETIVRDVFLYPANGDEPHVTSMTFSEVGHNTIMASTL